MSENNKEKEINEREREREGRGVWLTIAGVAAIEERGQDPP